MRPKRAQKVNLDQPIDVLLKHGMRDPIAAVALELTGKIVVARDIAHAKLKERLDNGEDLPEYFKKHIIYYVGSAKTPEGRIAGSFKSNLAGRMDSYVAQFQAGGSMIMLAKGNRLSQLLMLVNNMVVFT